MRITLDTTILVRANDSSTGLARELLITLLKAGHVLLVSGDMLYEAAKVLRYPRFRKFHTLTEGAFTSTLRSWVIEIVVHRAKDFGQVSASFSVASELRS